MEHQKPDQSRESAQRRTHRPPSTEMPRWVKVSLIVLAALAVLVAVALLSGHRPAQHGSAGIVLPQAAALALSGEASAPWL